MSTSTFPTLPIHVSVGLGTVDDRLVRHDGPSAPVPMHITVQGYTVFRA